MELFLFLLFINDIEHEVFNNIKMLADDRSLYCVVDNHVAVAESLGENLDGICQWSNDWCQKWQSKMENPEKLAT